MKVSRIEEIGSVKVEYNVEFEYYTPETQRLLRDMGFKDVPNEEAPDFVEWYNCWDGESIKITDARNEFEGEDLIQQYKKDGLIKMKKVDDDWYISKTVEAKMSDTPIVTEFVEEKG